MSKFAKCICNILRLKHNSFVPKLRFNPQYYSTCNNPDCRNPKCPNKTLSSPEPFPKPQACSSPLQPSCGETNSFSLSPKSRQIHEPLKSACSLLEKSCGSYISDPMIWIKKPTNIPYRSEVEQAAIEFYRKSLKAYTAVRRLVRNTLQKPQDGTTLDPYPRYTKECIELSNTNLLSVQRPVEDLSNKNQVYCNDDLSFNKEHSKTNRNTSYPSNKPINIDNKRSYGTCNLYSTSSCGCSTCPKCKKPGTSCTCKGRKGCGKKDSLSPLAPSNVKKFCEKYGKSSHSTSKSGDACKIPEKQKHSCGITSQKPEKSRCKPKPCSSSCTNTYKPSKPEKSSCNPKPCSSSYANTCKPSKPEKPSCNPKPCSSSCTNTCKPPKPEKSSCNPKPCSSSCANTCNPSKPEKPSCNLKPCSSSCTNTCKPPKPQKSSCNPKSCSSSCTNTCKPSKPEKPSCNPKPCSSSCTNTCKPSKPEKPNCNPKPCSSSCTNTCKPPKPEKSSCNPKPCSSSCTNTCKPSKPETSSCNPKPCSSSYANPCKPSNPEKSNCNPKPCSSSCANTCKPSKPEESRCNPKPCSSNCSNTCKPSKLPGNEPCRKTRAVCCSIERKNKKTCEPKKTDQDLLCKLPHVLRNAKKCERENIDHYFGSCYQNKEYFFYHKGTYFDMQAAMQKDRRPQPDSKKKFARKISVYKK